MHDLPIHKILLTCFVLARGAVIRVRDHSLLLLRFSLVPLALVLPLFALLVLIAIESLLSLLLHRLLTRLMMRARARILS